MDAELASRLSCRLVQNQHQGEKQSHAALLLFRLDSLDMVFGWSVMVHGRLCRVENVKQNVKETRERKRFQWSEPGHDPTQVYVCVCAHVSLMGWSL